MCVKVNDPDSGAGGAAFTNPSSGKIDQQRKILEELERSAMILQDGHCIDIQVVYLQAEKAAKIWQRCWSGFLCACFANNHWRIFDTGGNSVLRYHGL